MIKPINRCTSIVTNLHQVTSITKYYIRTKSENNKLSLSRVQRSKTLDFLN